MADGEDGQAGLLRRLGSSVSLSVGEDGSPRLSYNPRLRQEGDTLAALFRRLDEVAEESETPVVLVLDEFDKAFLTHLKVKAYVLDPRYEFLFMSDVTERARAAFREAGILAPLDGTGEGEGRGELVGAPEPGETPGTGPVKGPGAGGGAGPGQDRLAGESAPAGRRDG